MGAISLASLALGPHAPRGAELETVFPANAQRWTPSTRDKRHCSDSLVLRKQLRASPAHHRRRDKTKDGLEEMHSGPSCPPASRHDSAVKTALSETGASLHLCSLMNINSARRTLKLEFPQIPIKIICNLSSAILPIRNNKASH